MLYQLLISFAWKKLLTCYHWYGMFAERFLTNVQLIIYLCLENILKRCVWYRMFVEELALIRSNNKLLSFIEPRVFVIIRKPQPLDPTLSKFTYLHHTSLNTFTDILPFILRPSEWFLQLMSSDEHKTCLCIYFHPYILYEGWNFNSGNYLFTTDTK